MKLKNVFRGLMLVLLVVCLASAFSLNSKINNEEFKARINDRLLRDQHIAWIEKHYVPFQLYSAVFVIFSLYTLISLINSDYIDGKTYKIILFMSINIIAIARAVFILHRMYIAGKMAANGEWPSLSYLTIPLLTTSVLYILGQVVETSIFKDYIKDFRNNEDSDYSRDWKKLEKTLKSKD